MASWAVGPIETRALFRVHGEDALSYLQRMSTQDLLRLRSGESALTAVLDGKGHLFADVQVLVREDDLLLEMDPGAAPEAMAQLEKFVVSDDVAFEDLSLALRVVPLLGPEASSGLEKAGVAVGAGVVATLASSRRGVPAQDLIMAADRAESVHEALLAAGGTPASAEDLEALRVLGGRPRWGKELDRSRLPMEAGLTRAAISFTKGCYVGQEIVMRATARGHLQKGLVLLSLPQGAASGTKLSSSGNDVGLVTSVADVPEGRVGLGYVRRAYWQVGESLSTSAGEAAVRRVLVEEPEL